MSVAIPWFYVMTILLVLTSVIFGGLLDTTTDQTNALRGATELHVEHLRTLISITSTESSSCGYKASVHNRSKNASFGDFSKLDVFVRYLITTGDTTTRRLAYPFDWTVSSITGDTTNPNVWDPGETAAVAFAVLPELQAGTKGTIAVAVLGGISDSAYFNAANLQTCFFLHNDPTPPVGDTSSHSVLPMGGVGPSATGDLPDYDTDRDACTGLSIVQGGIGTGETDSTKFQDWRTSTLSSPMAITGDVTIDFYSALRKTDCAFVLDKAGEVTMFLRDHDGSGGFTDIGSGTISDAD